MNPDLVGPSGFQADVEQCRCPKRLLGRVVGNARATAGDDRELVVSGRVPPDWGVNRAARRIGMALSESGIPFLDRARLERTLEDRVRALALRHGHHTRRTDVQPMHDSLTFGRTTRRHLVTHRGETRNDGRARPPGTGVGRHSGRLVDDHHIHVVVEHGQPVDNLGR